VFFFNEETTVMKKLGKVTKVIANEKGQGMLEYVMLLAVVAALVLVFKGTIKQKVSDLTGKVGASADAVVNDN
jgi:Flp pilus assembly pilin Flp